jgi:DnaK suppressor protein
MSIQIDAAFIETQRKKLHEIRAALRAAQASNQAEETRLKETGDESREYEDDAQKLSMLELEGNVSVRDAERLERIERALRKIDEGSYGRSDRSGQAIPRARLEAVPEAIYTLEEEAQAERKGPRS